MHSDRDDLDDDDDGAHGQGGSQDDGERPVRQAHRRFLPYRTRGGGVMSVARSDTTMWTSSTCSPVSSATRSRTWRRTCSVTSRTEAGQRTLISRLTNALAPSTSTVVLGSASRSVPRTPR